jgi:hypothetical protein
MKPLADAALAEALIVPDCRKILLEQPFKAADASIISSALWTTLDTESMRSPIRHPSHSCLKRPYFQ